MGLCIHSPIVCGASSSLGDAFAANSRKLSPPKSSSKSLSSAILPVPFAAAFDGSASPFPSGPSSFSSTFNGSAASGTVLDCLRPDPFGLFEDASNELVESLETNEREDERGLKLGLWDAEVGAR